MARLTISGLLFFAACLVAGAPAARALDDPEIILKRIDDRYRTVTSFRAEFTQREKVATLGRIRESRGTVSLRRPGKMRWDYAEPDRRLVVSDGSILWLYYPGEGTVYRLALQPEDLERTPLALLFREQGGLQEFFQAGAATALDDGRVRLDLKPVRETRELTQLALITDSAGALNGTIIRDAYGNITEITLANRSEGVVLDDALFAFQPPAGTKILNTRSPSP